MRRFRHGTPGVPLPQIPPSQVELQSLAARLVAGDPDAVGPCVDFLCTGTRGHWHNRARALISRRLAHVALDRDASARVVNAVLARLRAGEIPQQFRDQLRLALRLDPDAARAAAREAAADEREYVRRFAAWVLARP